jgi:hypothetical protein
MTNSQMFETFRKETRQAIKNSTLLTELVELREEAIEYKCLPTYNKKAIELSK